MLFKRFDLGPAGEVTTMSKIDVAGSSQSGKPQPDASYVEHCCAQLGFFDHGSSLARR